MDELNILPEGSTRRFKGSASVAVLVHNDEPEFLMEALESKDADKWELAVIDELNSLEMNGTFGEVVDLPEGRKAIDTKWVFKVKKDAYGQVEKFKARLVARGFTQQQGLDYDEIYAPVVRHATLRIFIVLSQYWKFRITQLDIVTAYLNSKLDKEIYVKIPEGFNKYLKRGETSKRYVKLEKGLYGLKQAGRLWNEHCKKSLASLGFKQSIHDAGLYMKGSGEDLVLLVMYVDDILIATGKEYLGKEVEKGLENIYKLKLMGEVKSVLGTAIEYDLVSGRMVLHQESRLEEIGIDYHQDESKMQAVPILEGSKIMEVDKSVSTNEEFR